MTSPESSLRAIIHEVLDLALGWGASRDLRRLGRCLDHLALAGHLEVQDGAGGIGPDPPRADPGELYTRVAARYPELGPYGAPSLDPNDGTLVGDAVGDLTDIALDLGEVAWLWGHAGEAEALRHLRSTFRRRWGERLRGLQWVLHQLAPPR